MQANSAKHPTFDGSNSLLGMTSGSIESHDSVTDGCSEPIYFHSYYESCMEIFADVTTVASYLDAHREWFYRCAHPMTVAPIEENGYELTIGRFGSFGYEIEPKIGLLLLPRSS
jgi:Protein of unknown function (DUF1997)